MIPFRRRKEDRLLGGLAGGDGSKDQNQGMHLLESGWFVELDKHVPTNQVWITSQVAQAELI